MPVRQLLNAVPPNSMTPAERRAELCSLLAAGFLRLQLRNRGVQETLSTKSNMATTLSSRTERHFPNKPGETNDSA